MRSREQIKAELDKIVGATENMLVCPPLRRALMVRIAQELSSPPVQPIPRRLPKKIVSRETKKAN